MLPECLWKWHRIEKGRPQTEDEIEFVVDLVMGWIDCHLNLAGQMDSPKGDVVQKMLFACCSVKS